MTDTQQQLVQLHSLIESLEGNVQATTGLFEEFSKGEVSPEITKSFQLNKRQLESSLSEAKSKIKEVAAFEQLSKAAKKHGAINANMVAQYLIASKIYYEGADCNYLVERIKRSPDTAHLFGSTTHNVQVNPWRKESFNLTMQGELTKSNPSLAAQLKSEASR